MPSAVSAFTTRFLFSSCVLEGRVWMSRIWFQSVPNHATCVSCGIDMHWHGFSLWYQIQPQKLDTVFCFMAIVSHRRIQSNTSCLTFQRVLTMNQKFHSTTGVVVIFSFKGWTSLDWLISTWRRRDLNWKQRRCALLHSCRSGHDTER